MREIVPYKKGLEGVIINSKLKLKQEKKISASRKANDDMCFPSTVIWIPSDPTRRVATNGNPCLKGKYFPILECPNAENHPEVRAFGLDIEGWLMFSPTILLHCHSSSTGKGNSNIRQTK